MSFLCIKIILFLILTKNRFAIILKAEIDQMKYKQIVETATSLANENFNFRLQTVVVSKDVDVVIVDRFLKSFKGTVVIEVKRDGLPPEQVVIFLDSMKSFRSILDILKPDLKGKSLLHNGAKFIITILSHTSRIERIFHILWSYYVTNVVVVMRHKKSITALYTYFPYENSTNCQNTKPYLLGHVIENNTNINVKVFPDKMKNMQECPLYISTNKIYHSLTKQKTPLETIKKTMVQLLQEAMNFSPVILTKDYVNIDYDQAQNWSDSLNDVINGVVNISIYSTSLGVERFGLLDYSFPYFRLKIVWLAPPIKPGHVWLRLLSPLNGYMWLILLILLSFLKSLPLVLKLKPVKKFSHSHLRGIQRLKGVAFRAWGVMVGQPVRVSPKRFRDFYVVGMWMWFTFVVRSAYQSVLIGALKTETPVGNFISLEEAVNDGYRFGGRAGILAYFEHDPQIRDEFEIVPELRFEGMFDDVLEGKRKFVFAMSLEYALAYCVSRGINENECGHIVPDSIMTVPLVVWMKKYSPFMRPLTIWLQRFSESGLLDRDTIKPVAVRCTQFSSEPTPLTRNQTLSCFLCLIIGYILSILIFCFETYKNVTNNKK